MKYIKAETKSKQMIFVGKVTQCTLGREGWYQEHLSRPYGNEYGPPKAKKPPSTNER